MLVPVNDSLYFGAGVYNSRDQYVLFNNRNRIVNSSVLIYNAFNEQFSGYIDVTSSKDLVYALYTDHKMERQRCSDIMTAMDSPEKGKQRDAYFCPVGVGDDLLVHIQREAS